MSHHVVSTRDSAGAHAAFQLMLASDTRELFHRAILQSAPPGLRPRDATIDRALGAVARNALGADPTHATIDCVLVAQRAVAAHALRSGLSAAMVFSPQLGEAPLPDARDIEQRLREIAPRTQVMVGAAKHDALPFVAQHPKVARMLRLGSLGRSVAAVATRAAPRRVFMQPARDLVQQLHAEGGRALAYRFDWQAP